jgi:hypothetical protein
VHGAVFAIQVQVLLRYGAIAVQSLLELIISQDAGCMTKLASAGIAVQI